MSGRIRSRRRELVMTQRALAAAIGVTYQQIQKYERGTSRVGAGRLHLIAAVLGVPVSWFFECADSHDETISRAG